MGCYCRKWHICPSGHVPFRLAVEHLMGVSRSVSNVVSPVQKAVWCHHGLHSTFEKHTFSLTSLQIMAPICWNVIAPYPTLPTDCFFFLYIYTVIFTKCRHPPEAFWVFLMAIKTRTTNWPLQLFNYLQAKALFTTLKYNMTSLKHRSSLSPFGLQINNFKSKMYIKNSGHARFVVLLARMTRQNTLVWSC